jgi:AAA15 family ATPase/GTPase
MSFTQGDPKFLPEIRINDISISMDMYRCFTVGVGFETIKRVNVLIGQNNSGKSTLLHMFKFYTMNKPTNGGIQGLPAILIKRHLLQKEIKEAKASIHMTVEALEQLKSAYVTYKYIEDNTVLVDSSLHESMHGFCNNKWSFTNPLGKYFFCHLSADRDIVSEINYELENVETELDYSTLHCTGTGATTLIEKYINEEKYNRAIVEQDILHAFNDIVVTDLKIERIVIRRNLTKWEIQIDDKNKGLVSLSNSGSGFKTILLVLIYLHLLPDLFRKISGDRDIPLDRFIFAFEELENNLHPSIQRRLYKYIEDYSIQHKFTYFITTHSNICIDYYISNPDAQLFSVTNKGNKSTLSLVKDTTDIYMVIDNLGLKASDILQSNCVIWVEGPSDRIYINKWIELYSENNIIENIHYSIMFYGGKLLSHVSADETTTLVNLLKLNRNSIIVMDKDKLSDKGDVNDTKRRIRHEFYSNKMVYWITQGIEIENYISMDFFNRYYDMNEQIESIRYIRIKQTLLKYSKNDSKRYNDNKVKYASMFSEKFLAEDLKVLNLTDKIKEIVKKIKECNSIK